MRTRNQPSIDRQRGIALAIALIFLLILTIFGVTAMNSTVLEEKMAGNTKERNVAFQAAESALRVAENWINAQSAMPGFPNNSIGLYTIDSTAAKPNWENVNWSGTQVVTYPNGPGSSSSASPLVGVKTQPKYIIEYVSQAPVPGGAVTWPPPPGSSLAVYRITAHGTGGTQFATVELQSTYIRP